jgi:tripartite ATP-independent transporter DctM subunit
VAADVPVDHLAEAREAGERAGRPLALFAVSHAFELACITLMAAEALVVAVSVFFRYVLIRPIPGSEEIATLILVWLTFMGGVVATRRHAHLSVNIATRLLPGRVQAWLEVVVAWLTIGMLGVLAWQSLLLAQRRSDELSPGFGFNLALLPLPIAIGAVGMIGFTLAHLARLPRRRVLLGAGVIVAAGAGLSAASAVFGWDLARVPPLPLLLGGFAALLVGNAPVFLALGLPATGYLLLVGGSNPIMLPQIMVAGTDNFVLLAVPLFILAGALMETGGISTRLVNFAMSLVGHVRGGLAQVSVIAEILFSGISGSTVADVAAMSSVLLPAMRRAGYGRDDAVSVVSAASAMGILVPPSLLMVILGAMADLSVTQLFMAGFLPSFVMAAALMVLIHVQAGRKSWPTARRASLRDLGRSSAGAIVPMTMPVIIFGAIFTGAATVTEAAAIAALYALVVGVVVYREIAPGSLPRLFLDSSVMTATAMWIVGASSLFTWLLARQQVPTLIASWILSVSNASWFLILSSIFLFILFGALLEGFPAAIILGPILYPIAARVGIDLVHYSIIIVASVGIGLFLPPIGICLYLATTIGGTTVASVMRPFAPYLIVLVVALVLIGLVPAITLFLPGLLAP